MSQGVVGSLLAASFSRRGEVRAAAGVGWAGGMLADADMVIQSASDPLLQIEFHRHFTHSLAFVPLGGLLAAALVWLLFRRKLREVGFGRVYLYAALGYLTSGLLDACTSYGTHLWWPFSGGRVAWHLISIIDPIFTGVLLLLFGWAVWKRSVRPARWAVVFGVAYLALGQVQYWRAERAVRDLAAGRGHDLSEARLVVKPSLGNLVLWRGTYEVDGRFYADAVRAWLPGEVRVYEGASVEKVDVAALGFEAGSVLARDAERFAFFSDDWVAWHPDEEGVLADMRYAMVPNEISPLWGVRVDPSRPGEHVVWETFREADGERRVKLWGMIVGNDEVPKDPKTQRPKE